MPAADGKPAPKRAKVKPRTAGTPKTPPKPRKTVAPAKPRKAEAPAKPRKPSGPPPAPRERPAAVREGAPRWEPVPAPAPTWTPVPSPAPAPSPVPPAVQPPPRPAPRPFDPLTGAWLPAPVPAPPLTLGPVTDAPAPAAVDPAAYRKGRVRSILLNVMLGIVLAALAFEFLAQLVIGGILVFAPESRAAERFEEALGGELTPRDIIVNSLLTFTLMGLVPFLWVLGTRVRPWAGTVRFLQLRFGLKDILRGVVLVPLMLIAVYTFVVAYTCAIDGCGALDEEPEEDSPMAELLANLTWPVVITVALCAGIGEEILFRGVLQRWIGVWGQGLAFGLAHAVNAYPPQVIFAFGMGVAFGYLLKRGWSIVSLMIAHALYDFVLLALALLYPEIS